MPKLFMTWLLNALSLPITAYIIDRLIPNGFSFQDTTTTVIAAATLGAVNTFIRPVLKILTFPLTCLTFGLSAIVVNVVCLLAVDWYTPGFTIQGWPAALVGTLILSAVSTVLNALFNRGK